MRPQKQKFRHEPEKGIFGDCYRTCFAILLDLDAEEVPHFCEKGLLPSGEQDRLMKEWLGTQHGLMMATVPFFGKETPPQSIYDTLDAHSPGILFILSGWGRSNVNHCVVASGKGIVCDPSLTGSGIIGPCDDDFYWVTFLIGREFAA